MPDDVYRVMVDAIRDAAVYLVDSEGYVSTWNAGAELLHGYSGDEVIGEHVMLLIPATSNPAAWQAAFTMAVEGGECRTRALLVRKDGRVVPGELILTPARDRTGRLRGFTVIARPLAAGQLPGHETADG